MSESPLAAQGQNDQSRVLLETMQQLIDELHPRGHAIRVVLDSDLERDLGLDSLARVELLLRIERAFNVQLSQDLFAAAQTPRDLVAALSGTVPRLSQHEPVTSLAGADEAGAEPVEAESLLEVLEWHALSQPQRIHTIFYGETGEEGTLSYGELLDAARETAAGLIQHDLQAGQPVAIMLPTGAEFLYTFCAVLLAGGVPVPIYPPARRAGLDEHLKRQAAILHNARSPILVTVAQAKAFASLVKALSPDLRHIVTAQELRSPASVFSPPKVSGDSLALLQYTSGSTGSPKGVMLTHANLLANIRAMGEAIGVGKDDVFVSWLPLYHDMGLIGAWLGSLYYGFPLVLMSPLTFLSRPARWLWAIHHYGGTLSGGPNFAYALCLHKIADEDIEGLDLRHWRFAFNGAEPISVGTMKSFCRRFADYGFDTEAMAPVYGLAECSVGLAFPPSRRAPRIEYIKRYPFQKKGQALLTEGGEGGALQFISCGRPLPGHDIRIVDEHGRELSEGRQGRLQFKGPSATQGYYRNEPETQRLRHGQWLDSGDLAYLSRGEVIITGRAKELIIRAGRNIHPYELEEAVAALPQVRKGCVAAFGAGSDGDGTERLVVVAETREQDESRLEQLRQEINNVVVDMIGAPPDDVVPAPPHTVPKTSSGKLRRAEARGMYERGALLTRVPAWRRWLGILGSALATRLPGLPRGAARVGYGLYAWLIFSVLALLTWILVVALPRRSWRMVVVKGMGRLLLAATAIRVQVRGLENIAAGRPSVSVANHASYLDGLILCFVLPGNVSFIAKRELADNFVTGTFLRRIGCRFVERFDRRRGVEDTKALQAVAREGQSLLFFPEGTFVRAPGLRPFRMGAFLVAAEAGLPVVPVALQGTRHILPSGTWLPRRGRVTITVGAPLSPRGNDWPAAVQLRDAARAHILQHCGEQDLA